MARARFDGLPAEEVAGQSGVARTRFAKPSLHCTPSGELGDVAGPHDVFEGAARTRLSQGRSRAYATTVVGPTRNVRCSSGLTVGCKRFEEAPKRIDTLIVAGSLDFVSKRWTARELTPVARLAKRARRVASVCAGAFVLRALGLLRGRRATTHWLCLDALAAADPTVDVDRDAIYVRDENVYTSAGVTSGIDLSLALVEDDLGAELAMTVARLLVVYLHRPGGQSQFSAALAQRRPSPGRIAQIQAAIVDAPEGDHRVEVLAARAHMSARNFARVFTQQTGVTPARFVRDVRVEAARQLLERGAEDLDAVAQSVGLGTTESLRRAFRDKVGVPPSVYRARFTTRASSSASSGL